MSHDPTKILLESHGSSDFVASVFNSDPATYGPGQAVSQSSTVNQLVISSAKPIGVSMGRDLSNIARTSVARDGNDIPLRVAEYLVKAQLTFISKRPGIAIAIELVGGVSSGSEVVTVTGDDTAGYLISVQMDDIATKSTTTQIKTAIDAKAEAAALIEVQIASGQGSTQVDAFAEDDIDVLTAYAVGAAVRVSQVTGLGIPSGGTLTRAKYVSAPLDAVLAGSVVGKACRIDMAGGL